MTLSYPEQKLDLEGPGYRYDPKTGTGLPGFKGRHILYFDKCTGCQLCAIACDGVAVAIEMQPLPKGKAQNKKEIWPAVDYGRCVPTWTPVVTSNGIVPIERIHVGDRVLTHTGKFRRVSQVFRREYTGRVYTFRTLGNGEPLTVTEGHPVLVHTPEGLKWRMPDQIEYQSYLTRPIIKETLVPRELQYSYGFYHPSLGGGYSTVSLPLLQFAQGHSPSAIRMTGDMILSPVIDISVKTVADLEVMNLEVEEDNSFVASNQVVHNCVFCGLCVDPETEVATNPGLKPIKDIKVGERVLTHTGAYRRVSKIWRFLYTGPIYEVKAMGKPNSLLCTSDHRLLTVKRPSSKKRDKRLLRVTEPVEMVPPKDAKAGDYLLTPIPKKVIRLRNFSVKWNSSAGVKVMKLRTEPDLFRLIGYYLAEGSIGEGSRVVYLSFGSSEQELGEDARGLLRRYFGKEPYSQKLAHHVINVRLGLTFAMLFFMNFGRGAANKTLPDWVFFASKEKQVQLIKGMWLGDGCVVRQSRQKYLNITTTSKVLAYQLQTVLTRLGVVSAIHCEIRKNRLPAYRLNVFGRWAVKLAGMMGIPFEHNPSKFVDKFLMNEDYVFSPIESISSSHVTNREVMDITVEDDHTFVGQGIVQHNCVDACPFDALFMTNDYELSSYDKPSLKYSPEQLAIPPKTVGYTFRVKIDPEKGTATHG